MVHRVGLHIFLGVIAFSLLCIHKLCVYSSPAQTKEGQVQTTPRDFEVQQLTEDLLSDAEALPKAEKALLLAHLADAWRKDSPDRAQEWMYKAVETFESHLENKQRVLVTPEKSLAILRSILSFNVSHDQQLSERLIQILKTSSEYGESEVSNSMLGLAEQHLETGNIEQASDMWKRTLQDGNTSMKLVGMLFNIRQKDEQVANTLFSEAVKIARTVNDINFIGELALVAFPQAFNPSYKGKTPPDQLRSQLLSILLERLSNAKSNDAQFAYWCKLTPKIATLAPEYSRLIPASIGTLRSLVDGCSAHLNHTVKQQVEDFSNDKSPKTIDEFIKASEKARTPSTKATYLLQAAIQASREKAYDRAIEILENIKDRTAIGEKTWEGLRTDAATRSASKYADEQNYSSMQRIVDETPSHLRGFVLLGLVDKLAKTDDKTMARQYLQDLKKWLASASSDELTSVYLSIIPLYCKLLPQDSASVFRDVVKRINTETETSSKQKQPLTFLVDKNGLWKPLRIFDSISLSDENDFRLATAEIKDPTSRTSIRLSLLKKLLDRKRQTSGTVKPGGSALKANDK